MSQISHESYVFAAPEVAIGGIATLVQDGDEIELDISARRLGL
ncbi:dihydroxy-acid dehydratase [Paenibacillus sp. FSL R5-0923]